MLSDHSHPATIEVVALPAFEDNYIWALRRNGYVAVVDPGDAAPVEAHLAASGDRLCAILATHHHGDHIGGIDALTATHRVPVFAPAAENILGTTEPLYGGERIALAEIGLELDVMPVPGHTRGHLAYYRRGLLFCGDTLFGAGCGRLFEGTHAQLFDALRRFAALPPDTLVYCAHEYALPNLRFAALVEPNSIAIQRRTEDAERRRAAGQATVPSSLALELDTNPFLRWDAPAVAAAVTQRLGHRPADALETFTALREWRNRC